MTVTKGPKAARKSKQQQQPKKDEEMDEDNHKQSIGQATVSTLMDDETDYCVDCGKIVSASQQGLQCDCCGFWHHAKCEKISEEIYAFLQQHPDETTILWYCRKCAGTSKKMMSAVGEIREHQRQMDDRMSDMVKTMNGKIDELALELNKKLDNKCAEHDPTEWESHKKVEEKVDVLISAVKENIGKRNNNNGDDFEELEEIKKKKKI